MLPFVKAQACGNDFLYVEEALVEGMDRVALARALCHRHTGVGADGLILYRVTEGGAVMRLLNADGSRAEVSGNGVRALGAVLIDRIAPAAPPRSLTIRTEAGDKTLELLDRQGNRLVFRASMGQPVPPVPVSLEVLGASLDVIVLGVGNPQCVVLEARLSEERLHRVGPAIEHHPAFPEGTNVEFVQIVSRGLLQILIWERGVGVTSASGTGACAAAVAAAAFGGAERDVDVVSPGGSQRVEWRSDGLFLTGWAELVCDGRWRG